MWVTFDKFILFVVSVRFDNVCVHVCVCMYVYVYILHVMLCFVVRICFNDVFLLQFGALMCVYIYIYIYTFGFFVSTFFFSFFMVHKGDWGILF